MATRSPEQARKTVRIPLVGTFNQRTVDGSSSLIANQDQRFLNCVFDVVINPITQQPTIYVAKRPGWVTDLIVLAGNISTGLIKPSSFANVITAFGEPVSTIFLGVNSLGAITGRALYLTNTIIGSTSYIMIKSDNGSGWFFADDANIQLSYTGDTNTSTIIDNIPSTSGMYPGQGISGTNIAANSRIQSVDSATQITSTIATTGTTAGVTITKTPLAKIIDADFVETSSAISAFIEMNGFLYYITTDGDLRNSDLNSVSSYPALGFISTNLDPDPPLALARYKDKIIVLGGASKEAFTDVGNPTGSPLQRSAQDFDRIGTLSQRSVVMLDNDIYFVSSPSYGDVGVYQIKDLQLIKISSSTIDKILGTISPSSANVYANSFKLGGYSYIGLFTLTSAEEGSALLLEGGDLLLLESADKVLLESMVQISSFVRFLVYNIDLKIWSEWSQSLATFIVGNFSTTGNSLIATSRVNDSGKIYRLAPGVDGDIYTDDGIAYTMEIRTSPVDLGTRKRKFIHKIRLISDKQVSGTVFLSWSDDDYSTFGAARSFDLTQLDPFISACGSHSRGRVYKLTHSDNAPFRAEALEITYSEAIR